MCRNIIRMRVCTHVRLASEHVDSATASSATLDLDAGTQAAAIHAELPEQEVTHAQRTNGLPNCQNRK